jgi:bifunctional non-homologous end joining protein LigD
VQLAKPNDGTPINALKGTHAFDLKMDGVRAMVEIADGRVISLDNRNNVDRFRQYPELAATLPKSLQTTGYTRLDGEIICSDGFEAVALRDKQSDPARIAHLSIEHPARFIAFDVLNHDNAIVHDQPYRERRLLLESIVQPAPFEAWGLSVMSLDPGFLEMVREKGLEGVIAKRLDAPYRYGKRDSSWMKYKIVHRVTCVGVGYERGNGSRAEFGAMHLAMLDENRIPRTVGKVGTGFTTSDINYLKATMDAGDFPLVEIECANVTRSGVLRFPSYKGIRSDMSVLDATLDQLDTIPTT